MGTRASPSIDVTAAAMLVQLRGDIQRLGADLVLAHNIGQVRDVLAVADPEGEPPLYPSLASALNDPTLSPPHGRSPRTGDV